MLERPQWAVGELKSFPICPYLAKQLECYEIQLRADPWELRAWRDESRRE